jgi:uncharacterized protein (TIGR03118 family)
MFKAGHVVVVFALAAGACADNENETTTPSGTSSERVVARTDIVSDQAGAAVGDPMLVNAWGLAFNPAGPAWVSATETGVSLVYDASGDHVIPAVAIPAAGGSDDGSDDGSDGSDGSSEEHSAPTGQVFNGASSAFMGDLFIFVSEDGGISGWQPQDGSSAVMRVDNSSSEANYKGVTAAQDTAGDWRLYATDFHNGKVDVFDASYAPVTTEGGFVDTELPNGFAPFNVEQIGGTLVVTYARQDDEAEDDVPGAGNGYVDLFDSDGMLLTRLISAGELDSPWGVTMTPASFAAAPNRLLIGNFGDGLINVYSVDLTPPTSASATHEGTLRKPDGDSLSVDGLWALKFAPGTAGGFSPDRLYFTAGPEDETHGVFGALRTSTLSGGTGGAGSNGSGSGY